MAGHSGMDGITSGYVTSIIIKKKIGASNATPLAFGTTESIAREMRNIASSLSGQLPSNAQVQINRLSVLASYVANLNRDKDMQPASISKSKQDCRIDGLLTKKLSHLNNQIGDLRSTQECLIKVLQDKSIESNAAGSKYKKVPNTEALDRICVLEELDHKRILEAETLLSNSNLVQNGQANIAYVNVHPSGKTSIHCDTSGGCQKTIEFLKGLQGQRDKTD